MNNIKITFFGFIILTSVCKSDPTYSVQVRTSATSSDIQCDDKHNCFALCKGFEACKGLEIRCPDKHECKVICIGKSSCKNTKIKAEKATKLIASCEGEMCFSLAEHHCPEGGDCLITMEGTNSGDNVLIEAQQSKSLTVSVKGVGALYGRIDCPRKGHVSGAKCIMQMITDAALKPYVQETVSWTKIAADSASDVEFQCDGNVYDKFMTNVGFYGDVSDPSSQICDYQLAPDSSRKISCAPNRGIKHETTCQPVKDPTKSPTKNPTKSPTKNPTKSPTKNPTKAPTKNPTKSPTKNPTKAPTKNPTKAPTKNPTPLQRPTNKGFNKYQPKGDQNGIRVPPTNKVENEAILAKILAILLRILREKWAKQAQTPSPKTLSPTTYPTAHPTSFEIDWNDWRCMDRQLV